MSNAVYCAWTTVLMLMVSGIPAAASWVNFNTDNTPELAGDEVQFADLHNGTIWIGTLKGLSRYEHDTFTAVEWIRNDERRKAEVQAWSILPNGDNTWLVGTDRGVYTLSDNLLSDNKLAGNMIAPLLRHADGTVWTLAKNRSTDMSTVYRLHAGEWSAVEVFADMQIKDLLQTQDGSIWVIPDGDGAIRIRPDADDDEGEHLQRGMNVTSVFTDSRSRVWLGFWGRGVAVEAGGQWTQYLSGDRAAVLRIVEDGEGAIWIATSEALWRTDGAEFRRIVSNAGLVNLLYADTAGRIWISAQRLTGLRYWNGKDWTVSLDGFLPIRCMVDTGEVIWAGGVLDGIHRLDR